MQPTLWISNDTELAQGLALLSRSDFVALDTEFMRERTYYASLCLIQAAGESGCVIIDPLALRDLRPLWEFLADRRRLKVLHAARQDLEVLSQAMSHAESGAAPEMSVLGNGAAGTNATGTPAVDPSAALEAIPGPIFDTQIAAALLGHPAQVGYGSLVAERLGHPLAKGQTRTDWSRRPLSTEQLEYAIDDVRYLVPLYLNLRETLQNAGRLAWQEEESAQLADPRLYRVEPADAWKRLKGLDRLQPEQRATAKLLAQWRESRAMRKDRPRGWILTDEALREVAERLPADLPSLEAIRSLSPGFIARRAPELLDLIALGRTQGESEPAAFNASRPEPQQAALIAKLMTVVRSEGTRLAIAPELLATRRDVEQLVLSGRSDHLLQGWRREIIGERLVALASHQTHSQLPAAEQTTSG